MAKKQWRITVWIDGMDGDVFATPENAASAVEHALRFGATRIKVRTKPDCKRMSDEEVIAKCSVVLTRQEQELLTRSLNAMRRQFQGSLTLAPTQINEGVNAVFALEAKLQERGVIG